MLAGAFATHLLNSPRGPAVSFTQQVTNFLSGTPGFVLDPTDLTRMWTTSAKATLVSAANDPVGAIDGKFGTPTLTWQQAAAGFLPLWNGVAGLVYDGTNDALGNAAAVALYNNKPSATIALRLRITSLAAECFIISVGNVTPTDYKFAVTVQANGQLRLFVKRLDADAGTDFLSAVGAVVINTTYTLYATIDWATGNILADLNGTQVISGTYGTTGNTSASNSTNFFIGVSLVGGNPMAGSTGRLLMADKLATAGEKTGIVGWIEEASL